MDEPQQPVPPSTDTIRPRSWRALRYPGLVRATHWLNVVALFVMIMSGLQIFNAHTRLYAADASDPRHVVLALPEPVGMSASGQVAYEMVLFGRRVPVDGFSLTAIPRTFTLGGWLAGGRRIHFTMAWIFTLNGVLYLTYMMTSSRKRTVWPDRDDLRQAWPSLKAHLRIPPVLHGPGGGLNPLQKISYATVVLLLAPLTIATGLAMSPQWDAIIPFWSDLFGGRQFARTWHFVAVILFLGFTLVHVILVALDGPSVWWRMITGAVRAPVERSDDS